MLARTLRLAAPVALVALVALARCGADGASSDAASDATADLARDGGADVVAEVLDAGPDAPALPAPQVLTRRVEGALTGLARGKWARFSHEWEPLAVDPKYTHALGFYPEAFLTPCLAPPPSFGPLVLYSDDLDVLVFSPLDHFFASLVAFEDGRVRSGLSGDLEELPAGFTQRWLLVEGHGIAATLERWGEALRADHGRERTDRYADTGLSRLGYWTDNGAAYYYATLPDQTAEQTLLAVKADGDARGIPYGYFQIDSWWYFKEDVDAISGLITGGVTAWEPQPEHFPDGLAAFRQRLGLPLIAHNKWFAVENSYQDDHPFVNGEKCSLPTDDGVFQEFMANAAQWGIETYEQDWLWNQYDYLPWLRQRVERAERWMADLTGAATDHGRTMQLCMPSGAHLMDALDRPAVTTIRTSTDYKAGISKETWWPQFHTVNLLAWAVGLLPFKDNFRSAEAHGLEEALISTLSAGMVGPSDALGEAVPAILAATCRADGWLLKPDRPAFPVDAMFLPHQRPYTVQTLSHREGLGDWRYVAAFLLASKHPERTAMDKTWAALSYAGRDVATMFVFPEVVTDWHLDLARDLGVTDRVVAYDWRTGTAREVEGSLDLTPIPHLYDSAYLVLAPLLSNGLALIGEPGKFVTLADRRFTALDLSDDGLTVTLAGAPGEEVTLLTWDTNAKALLPPVTVTLDGTGAATVTLSR